jgi:sugar lactone lactonase YvrE
MQRMKKEVSPILAVVLILVALAAVEGLYWRGLLREEHRTMGGGSGPAGGGAGGAAPSVGLPWMIVETVVGDDQAGYRDGVTSEGLLDGPAAVAAAGGVVYIADSRNDAIRMVREGQVSTLAGNRGEGGGDARALRAPAGVVVGPDGSILVADTGHHRIMRVARDGTLSVYAGAVTPKDDLGMEVGGYRDGSVAQAQFRYPVGLAVDGAGAVYVADAGNHAVRRIFGGQVTTIRADGQMKSPTAVCVALDGSIWVSDTTGGSLWTGRPEGPLRQWQPKEGEGSDGFSPAGLALAADEAGEKRVYVADSASNCLFRVEGDYLLLVAGQAGAMGAGSADGTGDQARFLCPAGLAAGGRGEVYVADYGNNQVRRVRLGRTRAETHRHFGGGGGRRLPRGRAALPARGKEER